MKRKADKKKIRPPARKEEKRGWQNSAVELAMQQGERSDDEEKSQATQCPLKPAGGAYKGIKRRADSGEAGEQVEMKGG